jgi:hypothetical protein
VSTILKALRRLEEEKASAETGRPLREQVAAAGPPPRAGGGRQWLAAVAAVVLSALAGGGAIWWLFGGERSQEPISVAATPVAEAPAPAPAPQTEVRPAPIPGFGPPDDAFASDVETVSRPQPLPRLADSQPVEPRKPPVAGTRRPVHDTTAAARTREAAQREADLQAGLAELDALEVSPEAAAEPVFAKAPAPEAVPPPPAPQTAIAPPAPKAVAPAPPAPAPVREVAPEPAREVAIAEPKPAPPPKPPAAKPAPAPEALPEVLVERTQWHPLSDRRSAWLRVAGEEREVVEGDVIEGMLVGEIQPSGVVFERGGETLRRGVGER